MIEKQTNISIEGGIIKEKITWHNANEKLPFDIVYMKMAYILANGRSIDFFTKVGCIAVNDKKELIGGSYNGFPPNYDPDFDINLEENRDLKNNLIYHAEQNIILRHPRNSIHTIYLTISPCKNCAKMIAGHGIKRVVYAEEYHRETEFKNIFSRYKVEYQQLKLNFYSR